MKKLNYNEVVEKCKKVHGDKYIYPIDMLNRKVKNKVPIICKKHGEFWQILSNHYKGCGCPKCGGNHKYTTEEYKKFLSNTIRNKDISFEKVIYKNNHTPIILICKKHGEFKILPSSITSDNICPECNKDTLKEKYCHTTEWFIEQSRTVHGDKYDYSKVNYVNAKTKVCIIHPVYGEFWQLPYAHLKGQECFQERNSKLWLKRKKQTTEDFIKKAQQIHGNKYDYSKVDYISSNTKVLIICPEHGDFYQLPYAHLNGQGCPECNKINLRKQFQLSNEQFIQKAKEIHGDKYDYSKVNYINYKTKVEIICPKHGSFWQTPACHFKCDGCPTCKGEISVSKQELDIVNYIKEINNTIINLNDRQIINPMELDIYLPFKNIAIEYDGLYWHSNNKIDKNYHLLKTNLCKDRGIHLIHIFEDEWLYKQNIVKSRLKSIFGVIDNKIFARNCIIKEIPFNESKNFLEENHIQGNVNGKYRYGLFYNNELVSIMVFGSKRKSLGSKSEDGHYELLRFCNKLDTAVIGGASKLLQYFIKEYKPIEIISYCDRRWSQGHMYEKLGFKFDHMSKPNYYYIINGRRENRFKYRKSELVKQGFDKNKTEEQIMQERGIKKIYDCGTILYKLNFRK